MLAEMRAAASFWQTVCMQQALGHLRRTEPPLMYHLCFSYYDNSNVCCHYDREVKFTSYLTSNAVEHCLFCHVSNRQQWCKFLYIYITVNKHTNKYLVFYVLHTTQIFLARPRFYFCGGNDWGWDMTKLFFFFSPVDAASWENRGLLQRQNTTFVLEWVEETITVPREKFPESMRGEVCLICSLRRVRMLTYIQTHIQEYTHTHIKTYFDLWSHTPNTSHKTHCYTHTLTETQLLYSFTLSSRVRTNQCHHICIHT